MLRVPVKRLFSFKMKLLCSVVICSAVLYVATANVAGRSYRSLPDGTANENFKHSNVDIKPEEGTNVNTLRLVHVIFRHGDRTPIDRYPLDPYNTRQFWPEGWGKLTAVGKRMQYSLGQYIRRRYDGYLDKIYTSDEIVVKSSDIDRTIQSAMANMAGMWPPVLKTDQQDEGEVQQFVPVHTISALLDNKIGFSMPCANYDRMFSEIHQIPSERQFNEENEKFYELLSQYTGLKISNYHNVSDIYDILFVQKSHNLTLPKWTEQYFPEKLLPFSERWLKASMFTDEMLRLRAGPLVTEIVRNMKRAVANPSEEVLQMLEVLFHTPAAKFYVYSGHDTTISPLLNVLGVFDGQYPPYAASLYFELHEIENSKGFIVKVFYRTNLDKPAVELSLKRCSSNPCKFNDFIKSIEPWIIDEKQWSTECSQAPGVASTH